MSLSKLQQIEFSSVLFDSLFGLVIFFSLDSFLDITDPLHFAFYLFSLVIVVHWWLVFKATDDAFGKEVTDSGTDLVIGIIELILIEYIVLTARSFDYAATGWFIVAILGVDLFWTLIWRYAGRWRTKNVKDIRQMEKELDNNLKIVISTLALFMGLMVATPFISTFYFVCGFIGLYLLYVVLSIKFKIIDIDMF